MTTLAVDKDAASSAIDEMEFDEEHGEHHPHRNSVHHKLRASSSIMQLKKLLGKPHPPWPPSMARRELRAPAELTCVRSRQPRRDPHPHLPHSPRAVAAHRRRLQP